jgi:hypothetical protein
MVETGLVLPSLVAHHACPSGRTGHGSGGMADGRVLVARSQAGATVTKREVR